VYNLSTVLEDSAAQYPDRDAIVFGDLRLTYAQVNGAANQSRTCWCRAGSSGATRSH
jgi:non-ribosomal peptide synthetase component E (peptide arylation enzyme)